MTGNPILVDLKARVAKRTAHWPNATEKRLAALDEVASDYMFLWRQDLTNTARPEEKHAAKVLRRWLRIYAEARV